MRRAAFALLSFCLLVSPALFGGPAQAGSYGGAYVVGGYAGGGYYGPGPGWRRSGCCCRRVRRGLFTGCGGYYARPRVRYYVAPPPVRYYAPPPVRYVAPPPPPPVYYAQPRRRCPLVPRLDGRGGWVWAPNAACY